MEEGVVYSLAGVDLLYFVQEQCCDVHLMTSSVVSFFIKGYVCVLLREQQYSGIFDKQGMIFIWRNSVVIFSWRSCVALLIFRSSVVIF